MFFFLANQINLLHSDDEVRTLLCEDDTMDVLQSIGYSSVPSKENSRDEIVSYVEPFSLIYMYCYWLNHLALNKVTTNTLPQKLSCSQV